MCVESDPRSYEATVGPPITKAGALATEANDAAITLRATRPRTEPSHSREGRASLTHITLTEVILSKIRFTAVVAIALSACQSTWIDPASLPKRVSLCGLDWGASAEVTMTRQEAREYLGVEPIVFDPRAQLCPIGACTAGDPPGPARNCQEHLWAQVGFDQFVHYGRLRTL